MKLNNFSFFDGKNAVKATGNKIDAYDGSMLTNLKFMQLTDIGQPSGNKILSTNQDGTGIDYLNINTNASKQINITNENSIEITWQENICSVEHNMNGYVFIQLFDNNGYGVPIIPIYIDNDNIAFYIESKPQDNEIYKLICFSIGYTLNDMNNMIENFYNEKLLIENLNNTTFTPANHKIYKRILSGNQNFTFNSPSNINATINFKLYLITSSTTPSVTFPNDIIWKSNPSITETNSLYMFIFEWNPILNKWLGNQIWDPISLQ